MYISKKCGFMVDNNFMGRSVTKQFTRAPNGGLSSGVVVEENEDQRQFFRDLVATAEQTVGEVRGLEENYYSVMQGAMSTLPWIAGTSRRLQSCVEQDFHAAFEFARELSQAKDFQDFARIHTEYVQTCLQLSCAQAQDFFAEIYTPSALGSL